MGEKVVPLFRDGEDREPPLAERRSGRPRPRPRTCHHNQADIDPDVRKLFCRDCGEVLDAFEHLLKLAREDGKWREARDMAEQAARFARAALEETERKERNARARVRRLEDKEQKLEAALDRLDAELRVFTPDPQPERTTQ